MGCLGQDWLFESQDGEVSETVRAVFTDATTDSKVRELTHPLAGRPVVAYRAADLSVDAREGDRFSQGATTLRVEKVYRDDPGLVHAIVSRVS